jgi:hypothetical protein
VFGRPHVRQHKRPIGSDSNSKSRLRICARQPLLSGDWRELLDALQSTKAHLSGGTKKAMLWAMKLRTDLLKKLTPEMMLEGVVMNNHRYAPEPRLSKTGVGSLSSASTAERAKEDALSTGIIKKLTKKSGPSGKKRGGKS